MLGCAGFAACAAAATAGSVGAQLPPEPVCYDVHVGAWTPPVQDSLSIGLPARILVDTTLVGPVVPGGRIIRPAPGVAPSTHRHAFTIPAGDETQFYWSTGFTGARGMLRPDRDGALVGTLEYSTDVKSPEPSPTAPVRLAPVSCDAAVPQEWRPVWRYPRGFALSGGDSIQLAELIPDGLPILNAAGETRRHLLLDVRPLGLFGAATEVEVRTDADGRVGWIRLELPEVADPEGLVQAFAATLGEPTFRGPRQAVWRDRMNGYILEFGDTGVRVIFSDPRF
jgi:hypothetical protein